MRTRTPSAAPAAAPAAATTTPSGQTVVPPETGVPAARTPSATPSSTAAPTAGATPTAKPTKPGKPGQANKKRDLTQRALHGEVRAVEVEQARDDRRDPVGLAVLVGVFHPRSLAALTTDEHA